MLSCKDFVEQTTHVIENGKLSFGQKFQNYFHRLICHHCRRYLKQAQITATVSKKVELPNCPPVHLDKAVENMKDYADKNTP